MLGVEIDRGLAGLPETCQMAAMGPPRFARFSERVDRSTNETAPAMGRAATYVPAPTRPWR
jgi:hypothetical protein